MRLAYSLGRGAYNAAATNDGKWQKRSGSALFFGTIERFPTSALRVARPRNKNRRRELREKQVQQFPRRRAGHPITRCERHVLFQGEAMGLMDTIRKAEERSRETARRGLDRARAGWHESERALRRRMRVNGPAAESAAPAAADRDSIQRKPIVSINGKDVGPEVVPGARRIA